MMVLRKQQGLSLIELMIALLLGIILTLGVTQIYLSSSTTHRLTDGLARVQENARFVSDFMQREMREAGGRGCVVEGTQGVEDLRDGALQVPQGVGVIGWEYNNTGIGDNHNLPDDVQGSTGGALTEWANNPDTDFPANGPDAGDIVQGTDVIVIQGAHGHDLNGNAIGTNAGNNNNIPVPGGSGIRQGAVVELVSPQCDRGFRFVKGNAPGAATISVDGADNVAAANISDPSINTDESSILVHRTTIFYIGVNPDDEPALYQQSLENLSDPGAPEELVEGVESMQVLYGIGGPGGVNDYVTADDAQLTDWEDVVSIRISLLMRSPENVREDEDNRSFNLNGLQVNTPQDRRARLVTNSTVGVRNKLN